MSGLFSIPMIFRRNISTKRLICVKQNQRKIQSSLRSGQTYAILFPYMDAAIANAEKLEKINVGRRPSDSAPGTMTHLLVKKLKPYLK